jgi:hypothetical protein
MTRPVIISGESARAAVERCFQREATIAGPSDYVPGSLAIIWLDELTPSEAQVLARTIANAEPRPIAVRGERWDGFEPIPLAGHCRGIISGFGIVGLQAALAHIAANA